MEVLKGDTGGSPPETTGENANGTNAGYASAQAECRLEDVRNVGVILRGDCAELTIRRARDVALFVLGTVRAVKIRESGNLRIGFFGGNGSVGKILLRKLGKSYGGGVKLFIPEIGGAVNKTTTTGPPPIRVAETEHCRWVEAVVVLRGQRRFIQKIFVWTRFLLEYCRT